MFTAPFRCAGMSTACLRCSCCFFLCPRVSLELTKSHSISPSANFTWSRFTTRLLFPGPTTVITAPLTFVTMNPGSNCRSNGPRSLTLSSTASPTTSCTAFDLLIALAVLYCLLIARFLTASCRESANSSIRLAAFDFTSPVCLYSS